MPDQAAKTVNDFVISRVLDAPRDLVWRCFTQVERLKQWWGPKGVKIARASVDFRVGGSFHYAMQPPSGDIMWGKMTYREIAPHDRIEFINSFSDEAGGVTRHPMAPGWPMQMLSTFIFEDMPGGKTKFTVRWSPYEATPDEQATFDSDQSLVSMTNGWSGTLEKLEAYLSAAKQGA
jgi:uncharacterized protein YndB with AHSA1/START domain